MARKKKEDPVVIHHDERKEVGSRRDFELHRSDKDAWKPVSWAQLKKAAQTEKGIRALSVRLLLHAAKENEWLGDYQDFGLDLPGAIKAAKELIRKNLADSVWIEAEYWRPFAERSTTMHTVMNLRHRGHRAFENPPRRRRRARRNPAGGDLKKLSKLTRV
jgi:hypothetical protein